MKCVCCNKVLSDYEATIKHAETGAYLDTCTECLGEIMALVPLTTIDNPSLLVKDTEDTDGIDLGN